MKTYSFKVVVEEDEDFDGHPCGFHAFCPVLEAKGASTWGPTQEEALKNIREVLDMVVAELLEDGDSILEERDDDALANRDHWVSITV